MSDDPYTAVDSTGAALAEGDIVRRATGPDVKGTVLFVWRGMAGVHWHNVKVSYGRGILANKLVKISKESAA